MDEIKDYPVTPERRRIAALRQEAEEKPDTAVTLARVTRALKNGYDGPLTREEMQCPSYAES